MLLFTTIALLVLEPLLSTNINSRYFYRLLSVSLLFTTLLALYNINLEYSLTLPVYNGTFIATNTVLLFQALLCGISAVLCHIWASPTLANIYSIPTIREHTLVVLFILLGAVILVGSISLLSLFVSLELQSLSLYVIATIYRYSESSTSAGLKYLILGGFSSAIILLGTALLYSTTGSIDYLDISTIIQVHGYTTPIEVGLTLILLGILFKSASAPLHNWAPDVYDGTPTIITIWLTVIPKISLFIAIYILCSIVDNISWVVVLLFGSVSSLIIGTVLGLTQYRIKRLFTYSTISHIGFLLLSISIGSIESSTAFIFYLVQYTVANATIFSLLLGIGYIKESGDLELVRDISGIVNSNPVLALSIAIVLFSIAGIPPIFGFFAKINVLYTAISSGYYYIAVVAIVTSVISAYYYLRLVSTIYFSESTSAYSNSSNISSIQSILLSVGILIIVAYILWPNYLLNVCSLLALTEYTL